MFVIKRHNTSSRYVIIDKERKIALVILSSIKQNQSQRKIYHILGIFFRKANGNIRNRILNSMSKITLVQVRNMYK